MNNMASMIGNFVGQVPTQLNSMGVGVPNPFHSRTKWNQKRSSLPPSFVPGDWDVCCGRGKRNWNHRGNVRFRNLVQSNVQRYMDSPTRNAKTQVVVSIVDFVRDKGGHFLKQDKSGKWYDIGDADARDKGMWLQRHAAFLTAGLGWKPLLGPASGSCNSCFNHTLTFSQHASTSWPFPS